MRCIHIQSKFGQMVVGHIISKHIDLQILCISGKLMLMLQAIRRGHSIDPSNPHFHTCLVRFLKRVQETKDINEVLKTVLDKEMKPIYITKNPTTLNQEYLMKYPRSMPAVFAGKFSLIYLKTFIAKCCKRQHFEVLMPE
jgi:hypothetical protein